MTALKFYLGVWLVACMGWFFLTVLFSPRNTPKQNQMEARIILFLSGITTFIVWCFR